MLETKLKEIKNEKKMKSIKCLISKNVRRVYLVVLLVFMINILSKAQSIQFSYSPNKNIVKKEVDIDKKQYKINGDSIVCKGETAEFSVSTGELAQWSNGLIAIKSSFIITKDTIIEAIVINKYGCEFEKTKSIKVADLPPKPIIERFGDSLIVNNVAGNFEWYRNGLLFSVGLNFIRTSLEGDYTVKVIDGNGCENISDVFNFIISSSDELSNIKFSIYPNPAHDKIWIKPSLKLSKAISIRVFSIDGRICSVFYNEEYVDVSKLVSGYYIIVLTDKNKTVTIPFVKAE